MQASLAATTSSRGGQIGCCRSVAGKRRSSRAPRHRGRLLAPAPRVASDYQASTSYSSSSYNVPSDGSDFYSLLGRPSMSAAACAAVPATSLVWGPTALVQACCCPPPHQPPAAPTALTAAMDGLSLAGVLPNASPSEIRLAYRSLSKEFHPDMSADEDATEFQARGVALGRLLLWQLLSAAASAAAWCRCVRCSRLAPARIAHVPWRAVDPCRCSSTLYMRP